MAPWGDGIPVFDDVPSGAWGDGLPLGPVDPLIPLAKNFVAEILIGDVVVWSAINAFPQDTVSLDVSGITGKNELKFRIRGIA